MNTAILIHGFHLQAEEWESVVWGDPKQGTYGRIPAGLREALRFDASTIFFGTGSSKKDGLTDGECALRLARERILEVPEFAGWSKAKASEWLEARAVLETTSQTTADELTISGHIALGRGSERLVLVSSPTHIMRAHKTALSEFSKDEQLKPLLRALYAVASDVPYAGATVDDVLIIEPPHRADRSPVRFDETLKSIPQYIIHHPELAVRLNEALKETMERFKKQL